MVTADVYVSELEFKNQESFRGLVSSRYLPALTSEGVTVAEALRWESKMVVETIEIAALWLADTDSLALKLDCASYCGDRARHFRLLSERLAALGLAAGSYDPRQGGYSRLFGFLRSLQTSEERAAAGFLTVAGMSAARLGALASFCEDKGDGETARLLRDRSCPTRNAGWSWAARRWSPWSPPTKPRPGRAVRPTRPWSCSPSCMIPPCFARWAGAAQPEVATRSGRLAGNGRPLLRGPGLPSATPTSQTMTVCCRGRRGRWPDR